LQLRAFVDTTFKPKAVHPAAANQKSPDVFPPRFERMAMALFQLVWKQKNGWVFQSRIPTL
jgi:hypothetical protein